MQVSFLRVDPCYLACKSRFQGSLLDPIFLEFNATKRQYGMGLPAVRRGPTQQPQSAPAVVRVMLLPRSFLHRRFIKVQTQRRLLSAVLTPAADTGHILTQINGGFRALQLKKANGLPTMDYESLVEVRRHVEWWDENFVVNVSVLSGDGEHFCSGLDLTDLRGSNDKVRDNLEALCGLVTALDASTTPAVSILDGTCIGSGYALAMGKYKFATENSAFYIPEATLGLGLASGLSHTLPRLLGGNLPLALCLALTGMALEGPDLFFTQLATSFMTHRRLDLLMERLAEVNQDPNPFGDKTPDTIGTPSAVETLLERSGELSWNPDGLPDDFLHETKGPVPITAFVNDVLPQVEQVFAVESVEEAIDNLKGRTEPWAQMALHKIDRSSPLSLKVIFEQLRRGRDMGLAECLDDEFSVNSHLFGLPDFEMAMQASESRGGIPAWGCGSLEQISGDQVAAVFETVPREL